MKKGTEVKRAPRRSLRKRHDRFHHGDLREAVLALAEEDVARRGHGALSINDIARRLGVTGPAVYRHFADRRALLHEVAQRGYARFESEMASQLVEGADAWDMLAAVGRAYVRYAIDNPEWFRLQFLSHADDRPAIDLTRTPPRYRDRLLDALQRAFADRDRAIDAYRATWSMVHGIATILLSEAPGGADAKTMRERVDRPLGVFVAGLQALACPPRA